MKPENKEDHEELKQVKHHLEKLGELLEKRHDKGRIPDGTYEVLKGFNIESLKAVDAEIAAIE